MFILCAVVNENFLSVRNLTNVARQLSVGTIIAYGEMLLVIAGLIDLSVGSVLALAGVLSIATYQGTGSLALGVLVAIIVGILCNLINAVLVTHFDVPAFIATLAVQMSARGAALFYTKGQNLLQLKDYTIFGQGSIGPIPMPIIFMVALTIVTWYIMNHTRYGHSFSLFKGTVAEFFN